MEYGRNECLTHRETFSPWDLMTGGNCFKAKRGCKTTMQKHYYRAEHSVVVLGTAKVFTGDEGFLFTEK